LKERGSGRVQWNMVREVLTRPYPLSIPTVVPMVTLMLLVPFYIFIGDFMRGRPVHVPELALDRGVPLRPAWALVYGALYLFLIQLPVFVVRQEALVRRTILAYLMVWIVAYVFFLTYPTIAPRPMKVMGEGFVVWGLRFLYSADPPHNCFPSLHVAHSCVSALTCSLGHRGVGIAAGVCASLVGISTLYTRQHYVLDVIAGILLACVAYVVFLRKYPRESIPEIDRRVAPALAAGVVGILGPLPHASGSHIGSDGERNRTGGVMTRVLLVGLDPETVDYSDPALPPGMNAEKVRAGIAVAMKGFAERGWEADLGFIRPDASAGPMVERQLASRSYDCVVIGAGVRLPPRQLPIFEAVINAVHKAAPRATVAFNTRPDDSADAAARWLPAESAP
jgi:membrane-associated phospholipid phosphatase